MHDYLFAVINPDFVQTEILFKCVQFGLIADRQAGWLEVTQGDDAIIVIVVLGEVLQLEPVELIDLSVSNCESSVEESLELLKIANWANQVIILPRAQVPDGHPWPAHGLGHHRGSGACGPYKYVGSIMFNIKLNLYLHVGFLLLKMVLMSRVSVQPYSRNSISC